MHHISNPVIWKLFFLVTGLSVTAFITAVIGREAIWRPRDAFDKAFQNAFRALGFAAFVSVLLFCYAVTERCVTAEIECERFKAIAQAKAKPISEADVVTLASKSGFTIELEKTWNGLRNRAAEFGRRLASSGAERITAGSPSTGADAAPMGSRSPDGSTVGRVPALADLLEQFASPRTYGSQVTSGTGSESPIVY